jgi:hypothetical protein
LEFPGAFPLTWVAANKPDFFNPGWGFLEELLDGVTTLGEWSCS